MENFRKTALYRVLLKSYLGVHKVFIRFLWLIFAPLKIDREKIIFSNFNGGGFGDNPKYVAEACIRRGLKRKLYWVCTSPPEGGPYPEELTLIRPNTPSFVYHMSTAHFWVDNTRKLYYFRKKKGQIYIHTAHGGPGMKKIERDAEEGLTPEYISFAKRDSAHMDLLLSNSRFFTECLRSSYWYDGPIMEKGIPKNDLYFQDPAPVRKLVRDYYGIPEDSKLVLYVPTWREDRKLNVYHLDFEGCLDAFSSRFGGDWYMLMRMHPNVNAADFDIHYTDRVINASPYPNVQELIAGSDSIITDYSSCSFECIELDRPAFIYAEDYDEMKSDRGFYLDLEEIPAPAAFTNEDLIKNILDFSEEEYERRRAPFMERMGFCDDGNASDAVVDYILKRM